MKIALTADPELPVPPTHYGGIERVIALLADGLVRAGHEVFLFAHPDSQTLARLLPWPGRHSRRPVDTLRNTTWLTVQEMRHRFDLVHSFSRVAYLSALLPWPLPKLMTYQRAVSPRSVRWGTYLSRGSLWFSAVGRHMLHAVESLGNWTVIANAVDTGHYEARYAVDTDAPLVFLGRIEPIKGTHLAVRVARQCHRRLVIAGNIPQGQQNYFDTEVRPFLDGERIQYVGPVDDAQKNELLGRAAALLMPVQWEEPFGLVMAEALACGTPVIGLSRGAVPEVVRDGVSGYVRENVAGLCEAVRLLSRIERRACREEAERHFSVQALVSAHLDLYRRMTKGGA